MQQLKIDLLKTPKLIVFYLLLGFGLALVNKASIGLAPWGIFQSAISNILHITFGQATQVVGIFILCITLLFKVYPGIGTILNVLFVGFFIDLWTFSILDGFTINSIYISFLVLIAGSYFTALGTVLYISVQTGKGPRDGLSVLLYSKQSRFSFGTIKLLIEICALCVGALLGGLFGFGTIVLLISTNFFIDLNIKLTGLNPKTYIHSSIFTYFEQLKRSSND